MTTPPSVRRKGFAWRRWNNTLHRDIGYLTAALTAVYAISGIAVNHIHQWNPNYTFERVEERFTPFEPTSREAVTEQLVAALKLPGAPKDAFRSAPEQIELFYDGWSVRANVRSGVALVERPRDRAVLRDVNFLHLNEAKGLWTWIADLYAIALLFLAISGLFVLKGRKGLGGRGKWFAAAGLAIPALALVWLRYLG